MGDLQKSPLSNILIGYISEGAHLPLTLPIEAATVRIQTAGANESALDVVKATLAEGKYYSALPAYVALCIKPAIQDTVFDRIKAWASGGSGILTALQSFVIGAIARTISTAIMYPYIRAKVLIQSRRKRVNGAEDNQEKRSAGKISISGMILNVMQEQGPLAIFKGLDAELTRGVLSAALMLMVKERIFAVVRSLFRKK